MNIKPSSKSAFTLIEIMIVVAIIGMLAAMAIPNLTKNRESTQIGVIQNNLRVIKQAKTQWAFDNKKGRGDVPSGENVAEYMEGEKFPPSDAVGETYNINPIGTDPTATTRVDLGDYKAGDTISIEY